MNVRRVREEELEQLLALYKHLHPQDIEPAEEAIRRAWRTIHSLPSVFQYFVIEQEGLLLASCNLSLIPNLTRGARSIGLIENVVTHPGYRMQGLGKKLIEHAISCAIENNCYKVMLLSDAKRVDSHHFYTKLGFNGDSKTGFAIRL